MGFLEVIIIILGIIIFVGSFFLPDSSGGKEVNIPEEKLHEMIEKEIKRAKFEIEEHLEEITASVKDKTERSMERLSNEKIKAIDEFSNTVIDRIYKNHEEAVFLYDMLSNKQVQVKHSIADLEKTAKEGIRVIEEKIRDAEYEGKEIITGKYSEEYLSEKENEEIKEEISADQADLFVELHGQEFLSEETKEAVQDSVHFETEEKRVEQQSDDKNKVLELHKGGKTDLEIAKELGLGIGEVKLIIGLFEANR